MVRRRRQAALAALPAGGKLIHVSSDGDWDLPIGTVLIKEFSVGGKRVETRLFVRHDDGDWAGYSYEWDDDRRDATLLPASQDQGCSATARAGTSRAAPTACGATRRPPGRTLGLETAQMNRDAPAGGGNQLDLLDGDRRLRRPARRRRRRCCRRCRKIDDMTAPVDRARARLPALELQLLPSHGRHRAIPPDWRFSLTLMQTGACNATPLDGDLGHHGREGDHARHPDLRSSRCARNRTDAYRMPPLASHVVDPVGTAVIDAWITSLTSCN